MALVVVFLNIAAFLVIKTGWMRKLTKREIKMRKFILKREIISNKAILGTFFDPLDSDNEICKTLENPWKDNQEGISCIPAGTYSCTEDTTGRFKYWKVLNVEGRSGVEIHNGNIERHTRGCILFGKSWAFMEGELAITSSRLTLDAIKDRKILPKSFKLEIIES